MKSFPLKFSKFVTRKINLRNAKISNRAEHMPASPIRKLVPFSIAAKQKGIKVYHLNIGQPDIETPQSALDALKIFI
jgi:hypothetical protein